MKISYNWLKWYIPEIPKPEKLAEVFSYHLCEVESLEVLGDDFIFDIKILPDRAHDLLSHQGVARELASLLDIKFIDPGQKYKIPLISPSPEGLSLGLGPKFRSGAGEGLKIVVESEKCRRYMGRIVRNVKVGPSPEWIIKYLESIGQRSINNIVDAANIVMYGCGQPTHCFDLNKMESTIIVRGAKEGENLTTLDNKEIKLNNSNMIIADAKNVLAVAGIKGGKIAEVDNNTEEIILEVANFDPTSVRKTAQALNISTDAQKRYENDLSPELCPFAMQELSSLILEMCPEAVFEDIVDVYPKKQKVRKLSFGVEKVSKILGLNVSVKEIEDILKRYNFEFILPDKGDARGLFKITVPPMRLDLAIEEDMAEEVGRILGYDKVKPQIPHMSDMWKIKQNETYSKIIFARNKLLNEGYSEVMTYVFRDQGEVEVLASASDKKFLRTNLSDGLKESLKLNQLNMPLLGMSDVKIFEIGTIFKKGGEEMRVAWADDKEIKEMKLDEFTPPRPSGTPPQKGGEEAPRLNKEGVGGGKFKMWSLFPFISRDIAVWVPEKIKAKNVAKIIKKNIGDMAIRGPELFDEFKKGSQISYAFRLVFQSYDRTLTDPEVNDIMTKITNKIKEKNGWQVR